MRARAHWLVILLAIAAGVLFMWLTQDLPFVRNGLLYARTTLKLMSEDIGFMQSMHDHRVNFGKGVGMSWVAAALAKQLGVNLALRVVSAVGSSLFLLACLAYLRRINGVLGIDQRLLTLEMAIVVFNPLTMSQFWAAYSDIWLAAAFVVCCHALDVYLRDDGARHELLVIFFLSALAAIMMRIYGAIVVPAAAALAFTLRTKLTSTQEGRRKVIGLGLALAALVAFVVLGKVGAANVEITQLMTKSDAPELKWWLLPLIPPVAALQFATFLLVTLAPLIITLRHPSKRIKESLSILPMALVYTLPLFVLFQTATNLRFFLPLLPFLAAIVARTISAMPQARSRRLVALWCVVQTICVLNENVPAVHAALWPVNRALKSNLVYVVLYDNLRMHEQLRSQRAFAKLEQELPKDAVLYIVSDYYMGALAGLHRELGILKRTDLDVRYRLSFAAVEKPESAPIFVYVLDEQNVGKVIRARGLKQLEEAGLGRVTDLGNEIYKVERQ